MNVPFTFGVGGVFDIIAGKTKRAPLWMQRIGLEWFYRLIQEPKRMWKRYLFTNTMLIYYVLRAKLFGKLIK
jgi:N-acetylglucosaminyldiphosphoundecaprenol N-acetyl-beta-D-mannosaminyltransferase